MAWLLFIYVLYFQFLLLFFFCETVRQRARCVEWKMSRQLICFMKLYLCFSFSIEFRKTDKQINKTRNNPTENCFSMYFLYFERKMSLQRKNWQKYTTIIAIRSVIFFCFCSIQLFVSEKRRDSFGTENCWYVQFWCFQCVQNRFFFRICNCEK